ncbi:MAG: hypothetical protein JWQ02_3032 [Capsulimonas sp.]|nr:hypothetical protein [Capsulimonas sp.]
MNTHNEQSTKSIFAPEWGEDENRKRPTVDELDTRAMTRALLWHCFKEGARLGLIYGAGYGIFFFLWGIIYGAPYGLAAGILAGLLNGATLSVLNAKQRTDAPNNRHFLKTAASIAPLLTFFSCYFIFRLLVELTFNGFPYAWWKPDYRFDLVPSLIASFLAWHAARDMENWYLE